MTVILKLSPGITGCCYPPNSLMVSKHTGVVHSLVGGHRGRKQSRLVEQQRNRSQRIDSFRES